MRNDPSVIALVARAGAGDQEAWNGLIERYAPLVWSICQRHELSRADIDDVGQNVWLLLVEHISGIRDAAALPGWLATTTRHECFRVQRARQRFGQLGLPHEDQLPADPDAAMIEEELIEAERNAALLAALAELSSNCRELLSMLVGDPPLGYAEISARMRVPVGSIGPTRGRCLSRLRRSPHLAAFLGTGTDDIGVVTPR